MAGLLTIPYCPHDPRTNKKQVEFLLDFGLEALYGGAAGGGKSDALLMAALQFATVPGYAGIIFRKTFTDLKLPGALIDRSMAWLADTPARWNAQTHTWHFPAGSSLSFGYMETSADMYRYQSAEFQFIGFDEVTQFTEDQYRFMFTRLRRPGNLASDNPLSRVPLRMRAATNPIGVGKEWVKRRFPVDGKPRDEPRTFIPATIHDNKHLDAEEYIAALNRLDPITRKQMLLGDWDARAGGRFFGREWWGWVGDDPKIKSPVRYWDLASSTRDGADFTVGVKMGRGIGIGELPKDSFCILDIIRFRGTPLQVEQKIKSTAAVDGKSVPVYIEQDPAQAGASQIDYYRRHVLVGYTFRGHRIAGDKSVRAGPFASQVEGGNVFLIRDKPWVADFIDECDAFPDGDHDDQIDACSGAFDILAGAMGDNVFTLPITIERGSPWKV